MQRIIEPIALAASRQIGTKHAPAFGDQAPRENVEVTSLPGQPVYAHDRRAKVLRSPLPNCNFVKSKHRQSAH